MRDRVEQQIHRQQLSWIQVPAWTHSARNSGHSNCCARLPDVVEALGTQLRDHHRADHHASMAAEVLPGPGRRIGARILAELAHAGGTPLRRLTPAAYR